MQSDISKCNQCNSILHDDDLIICEDIDGLHKGCPICCTDTMLMELEKKEIENETQKKTFNGMV